MKENLNFEDKVAVLYNKVEWKNPSIKSKLKKLLKIRSDAVIISNSDLSREFMTKKPDFFREVQNLTLASFNISKDIEKSPVERILNLRLKEKYNDRFLKIFESHIPFLFPFSLSYFLNLNWTEYVAFVDKFYANQETKEKLLFLIVEIAYCSTRSSYSYLMFCMRMLEMQKVSIHKSNLTHMRIYLECLNHAEMNLVLNRAIVDKVLEAYAYINGISLSGKGELNKKIEKISKVINQSHPMSAHWSAFVQVSKSEHFNKINSYRTGLVHKFSSNTTAFHKKSFDGIREGLRSVEDLVKCSNDMGFFAFTTLLLSVNESTIAELNSKN